jgi:hypothetical protein
VHTTTVSNASLAQSIRNHFGRPENVKDDVFGPLGWPSISGVGDQAKITPAGIISVLVGSDYVEIQIGESAHPTQAELVTLGRAAAKKLTGG